VNCNETVAGTHVIEFCILY